MEQKFVLRSVEVGLDEDFDLPLGAQIMKGENWGGIDIDKGLRIWYIEPYVGDSEPAPQVEPEHSHPHDKKDDHPHTHE